MSDSVIVYRSRPYLSSRVTNVVPQSGGAGQLDAATKSAAVTLSGGNLVATVTSGAAAGVGVKSVTGHSTGKWCFKVTVTDMPGGFWGGAGIVDSTFVWGVNNPGVDAKGCARYQDANVYCNGLAGVFTAVAPIEGESWLVAVDVDADRSWWKADGGADSGLWNGEVIGVSDPAAGIGGEDSAPLTAGLYYVCLAMTAEPLTLTVDFFPSGKPAGFSDWG
jgi:hypothetical protein